MGAYLGANQIVIFGGQPSGGGDINNQDKTVTPSESQQSITADVGYTGLGTVTVNAVSSTYVGSGIDRCDSSDLTASGDTVTVPSGYYENNASTSVSSGTAGTPSATKGAVSDHSISVTPSVTNTSGYITGSTITGTPVTVSASELVSGSETKTANGTYDVTNLASLIVDVSGGGGDTWTWMGKNPTKVATCADDKVYLKDTSFATWTPSTTAKNIVSSSNCSAQTIDVTSYDYFMLYKFHSHLEYGAGATGANQISDEYYSYYQMVYGYHNNLSDMNSDVTSTAGVNYSGLGTAGNTAGGFFYKDGNGTDKYSRSTQQGIYFTTTSLTISPTATSVIPKKPPITAKCNASYFSTANCAAVNQEASYYELKIELWRVDHQTTPDGALYKIVRDMWINGF